MVNTTHRKSSEREKELHKILLERPKRTHRYFHIWSLRMTKSFEQEDTAILNDTNFETGDVVTLKSGSPEMTVGEKIDGKYDCCWFVLLSGKNYKWDGPFSGAFVGASLELVKDAE